MDPNPDNDIAPMVFNVGLPARAAPVPLMPLWSLLLLSGFIAIAGLIATRRNT